MLSHLLMSNVFGRLYEKQMHSFILGHPGYQHDNLFTFMADPTLSVYVMNVTTRIWLNRLLCVRLGYCCSLAYLN